MWRTYPFAILAQIDTMNQLDNDLRLIESQMSLQVIAQALMNSECKDGPTPTRR